MPFHSESAQAPIMKVVANDVLYNFAFDGFWSYVVKIWIVAKIHFQPIWIGSNFMYWVLEFEMSHFPFELGKVVNLKSVCFDESSNFYIGTFSSFYIKFEVDVLSSIWPKFVRIQIWLLNLGLALNKDDLGLIVS